MKTTRLLTVLFYALSALNLSCSCFGKSEHFRIIGDCTRTLENPEIIRRLKGQKVGVDTFKSVLSFELNIDNECRWSLFSRYNINNFRDEVVEFSDAIDCYALAGESTNRAASISAGLIPQGGMGHVQTVWFAVCRPFCSQFDVMRLDGLPNLIGLQDRQKRPYNTMQITTNTQGIVIEASMTGLFAKQELIVDHFKFDYLASDLSTVPREVVRQTYGYDPIARTNVLAYKYLVLIRSVEHKDGPVSLPMLSVDTRIADFRLSRSGSEGSYIEYSTRAWRSESDLRKDPVIRARIKVLEQNEEESDRLVAARNRKQWIGRAFFGLVICILVSTMWLYSKKISNISRKSG